MAIASELRIRARQVLGPVLGIYVVGYFAFHAVQGERGLIAWWHLKEKVAVKHVLALSVGGKRTAWTNRVARLNPQSLDPDMLDEQTRRMLGYADENEMVILTDSH